MPPSRAALLASAQALCADFAASAPSDALLAHFSTTHRISAVEHGEPLLAPFIGRPFAGRAGPRAVPAYFALLSKHLAFHAMSFGAWVVDAHACRVCAKGRATFTWTEGPAAHQSWEEEFVYMLDFDDQAKVTDYQVWADSGAAYLARRGELADKRKEFEEAEAENQV